MMRSMYALKQVPSEAQIRKRLRRIIFGPKLHCPECFSQNVIRMQKRFRCRVCRRKFSLFSHTWLNNLKLPLETFWLVCWCWVEAVPVKQAQKLTYLSEEAVRHWYEQFRVHLPHYDVNLSNIVQMDEAYFKQWVLVMAKDASRQLAYSVVPGNSVQRHHAVEFVQQYVDPRTVLATDGAGIYRGIER